jgi:hypothetical protein
MRQVHESLKRSGVPLTEDPDGAFFIRRNPE